MVKISQSCLHNFANLNPPHGPYADLGSVLNSCVTSMGGNALSATYKCIMCAQPPLSHTGDSESQMNSLRVLFEQSTMPGTLCYPDPSDADPDISFSDPC